MKLPLVRRRCLRSAWRLLQWRGFYRDGKPVVYLMEDAPIPMPTGSRGPIVDHVAFVCTEPAGNGVELQFDGGQG